MNTNDEARLTVYSPLGQQSQASSVATASRLPSLEGRTVGLLWNGKPNGDVALRRVGELLRDRTNGLSVRFYSGSLPCGPALLDQAHNECDAIIACTAD